MYKYIHLHIYTYLHTHIDEAPPHGSQPREIMIFPRPPDGTGWRRLTGSPQLQIIFHKRATKYRSLLQKMTYKIRDPMSLRQPVYTCICGYVCTYMCVYLT